MSLGGLLVTLIRVRGALGAAQDSHKHRFSEYILKKSSLPGSSVTRHFSMLPLKCSRSAGAVFGSLLEGIWMAVWAL